MQALSTYPQFYRVGAIGPDGFPDVTSGQTVIHPENTGEWMQYIFKAAWDAQTDPRYPSDAERLQILAFGYGYLTHAAGDMWAHTLVNDLSLGVFPGVGEILTEPQRAGIAIRHLILESYIGDATNHFDGNPDRNPVGGDVSDTSTPGIGMDAPHVWVYNTLIDPAAPTPTPDRGPIIDKFLELRAALADELDDPNPDPLQDALNAYNSTVQKWNAAKDACDFEDIEDVVDCPLALAGLVFQGVIDSAEAFVAAMTGAVALAADTVKDAYIAAWIDDIDEGLKHWNELGLAITRGMFDPQARRDAQNDACWPEGGEGESDRASCEDGLGMTDVVLHQANDFILDHLLSMAGAPDLLGDVIGVIQDLAHLFDFVSLIFDQLLNPIDEAINDVKETVKDFVLEMVQEALGIDIELISDFVKHPTYWLNVESVNITLPGVGLTTIELFPAGTHERLDAYLGLGPDHHTGEFVFGNLESTRLSDDAVMNETGFSAFNNLLTTERLVLLDHNGLNQVMANSLFAQGVINSGVPVGTYPQLSDGAPTNVMFHPLTGTDPWLQSIDSDHSWRVNPLPVFCSNGSVDCTYSGLNPTSRDPSHNAGNGQFPIWESCLLRPAFRDLFVDWEKTENFPDLNDAPSADSSDPNPPVATLTPTGNIYTNGGTTYVGNGHTFTLGATDTVFTTAYINVEYRIYPDGTTPGAWLPLTNGGSFSIPSNAGDGVWRVDYRTEDPCHTFVDESGVGTDPLPPASGTATFILDTTAPVISIVTPLNGQLFDTDDMSAIDYTVDDGVNGSGVASHAVTFNGAAATDGQVLDMFLLDTGTHTIRATSVDNLGNGSELTWTFKLQATSASLMSNIDRGAVMKLIRDKETYVKLRVYALAAAVRHAGFDHKGEWDALKLMLAELKLKRGKTIVPSYGDKIAKWAQEIIDQKR